MHPWRTPTTSAATARRLQAPHLQPARRLHFRVPVHGQARAQSRVPLLAAYRGHGLPPPSASASRAHPGKNTGCGLPRAPCPSTSTTARLVNLFSPTALHYRRHLALGAPCSAAAPLWSRCAPPSLRPSAATAGRAGWPASAGSFPCCSFPPRPPAPDLALPSLPALPTCGRAASARRSRGEGDAFRNLYVTTSRVRPLPAASPPPGEPHMGGMDPAALQQTMAGEARRPQPMTCSCTARLLLGQRVLFYYR